MTNEVEELARFFETITVIPTTSSLDETKQKPVPGNVKICRLPFNTSKLSRLAKLLGDSQALSWFLQELPNAKRHGTTAVLKLLNWTAIASEIKQKIKQNGVETDALYYSYWLTPSATALAMLKDRGEVKYAASRVHGGDLYWERHTPPYLPFQKRVIQELDQVYSISSNGKEYLTKRHQISDSKISINRLGTKNEKPFQPAMQKSPVLRIISCAYLKPVKRIHLLVEALKSVQAPIEWTHIGDGPERARLEGMVKELPNTVTVRFLGNLNNQQVLKNYRDQPYDLFINVSESEGIPVTIMEAFSFGIPVIATDVGGTSELVNEESGYLLPKDFAPERLAQILTGYYQLDVDQQNKKAQSAYETWFQHYNALKNYEKFAETLKGVSK
ncbi:MAG: glycosyltransferase [Bacillota bacterium]|nr:glycosyltransferase [Bacillota bacterium]